MLFAFDVPIWIANIGPEAIDAKFLPCVAETVLGR